jgi:hypothetical protein
MLHENLLNSQEILPFLCNPKVHYRVLKKPANEFFPELDESSLHIFNLFLKINFNITFPSTSEAT